MSNIAAMPVTAIIEKKAVVHPLANLRIMKNLGGYLFRKMQTFDDRFQNVRALIAKEGKVIGSPADFSDKAIAMVSGQNAKTDILVVKPATVIAMTPTLSEAVESLYFETDMLQRKESGYVADAQRAAKALGTLENIFRYFAMGSFVAGIAGFFHDSGVATKIHESAATSLNLATIDLSWFTTGSFVVFIGAVAAAVWLDASNRFREPWEQSWNKVLSLKGKALHEVPAIVANYGGTGKKPEI